MCGEKIEHLLRSSKPAGSPPRVRGKAPPSFNSGGSLRITPACAGKSLHNCVVNFVHQDHPRVCGEKKVMRSGKDKRMGSPPRVRGKVTSPSFGASFGGITPACAGKSKGTFIGQSPTEDHPRVCGEKQRLLLLFRWLPGSPPRVRGKENPPRLRGGQSGITPACAGKRLKRSRSTVPHAAIVPLFPSVCNKPAGSDGSPAGHDAPPFLPLENAAPASPAYNLRSL